MSRIARVFLAGFLAILPLIITAFAIGWLVSFMNGLVGPQTSFGGMLFSVGSVLGIPLSSYVVGFLTLFIAIFALGLLVESRLGPWFTATLEAIVGRIPIISQVYDLTKRFTSIVDAKDGGSLKGMNPVWCFFGGEPGAAVLALLPSSKSVTIGNSEYVGIMVPSAPVPFGGALIYVPSGWIRPAEGGVEELMSVYISMGVTPPKSIPPA